MCYTPILCTCSHARIAGLVSRQLAEDSSVVSSTFHRLGDDVSRDLASDMETPSQASSLSFRTRSLYTTMTCRQTTKVVGSSIGLCTYKKGWLLPVCTTYPITKRQSTPIQANFSSLPPKNNETKQNENKNAFFHHAQAPPLQPDRSSIRPTNLRNLLQCGQQAHFCRLRYRRRVEMRCVLRPEHGQCC